MMVDRVRLWLMLKLMNMPVTMRMLDVNGRCAVQRFRFGVVVHR